MITNKDYKKEIIRDIDGLGDRSEEIDPKKEGSLLQEIVLSLKQTMKDNDIVSLSAPQIGYKKRVFCVKFGDTDYRTFVNTIIDNVRDLTFARDKIKNLSVLVIILSVLYIRLLLEKLNQERFEAKQQLCCNTA